MSGSPLLEHLRRHKPSDSPVRPRVLAPLFANAAASDVHGKFSGSRIDQVQYAQNVDPGAQVLLHSRPLAKRSSPAGSSGSKATPPQLVLVPKSIAKLAACGRGALLKMIDPQPDWTLSDLRAELDALEDKISISSQISEECSYQPESSRVEEMASKQRWAWDDEVADFSRPSKPFIMRLDDDDDDEDDEEEEIEKVEQSLPSSARKNHFPESLATTEKKILPVAATEEFLPAPTDKVEAELYEADRMRLLRVQEELRLKRFQLESVLMEETQRSAEKLAQVMKDEDTKCEMTRRADKQYQRIVAEQRDKHLSALQRDHEQRSQVEERKIRKEEEAQRREVAVREEQRRAKAEAEAAAAAKTAEAERVKKAEIQRVETEKAEAAHRAEAEKREAEQKQQKQQQQQQQQELASKKRSEGPQLKVSKAAADDELSRRKILQELHQASQSLQSNPTHQKNYKVLGYQISKILNQVTATEEQVRKKSMELLHLLNTPQIQAFVVSTLASKLMSQCETQVSRVPSYAYVFARIVVIVSNQVPVVMDAMIAQLNSSCILTVPKFFMYNKADYESDKSYFKLLGYREDDTGTLETADEFVSRMSAYVTLYAAITQTQGDNRHGISNGWAWCARLLNHLPANRYTASVLFSYFETAGFRLHETYPKPFAKLMQSVVTKFIPLLQKHNDPDARAVLNRLETYIVTQQFLKRPNDQLSQQVYSTTVLRES